MKFSFYVFSPVEKLAGVFYFSEMETTDENTAALIWGSAFACILWAFVMYLLIREATKTKRRLKLQCMQLDLALRQYNHSTGQNLTLEELAENIPATNAILKKAKLDLLNQE